MAKTTSLTNRWGTVVTIGATVKANQARGGHVTGKVTKFDRTSSFARAYGIQVKLDDSIEVGLDDIIEVTAQPLPVTYVTTYCNHPHRLKDGKPVNHNCYILPPDALEAERNGDTDRAIELLQKAKPLIEMRKGVKG